MPAGIVFVGKSAGLVPLPLLHFSCTQPTVCQLLLEGHSVAVRKRFSSEFLIIENNGEGRKTLV